MKEKTNSIESYKNSLLTLIDMYSDDILEARLHLEEIEFNKKQAEKHKNKYQGYIYEAFTSVVQASFHRIAEKSRNQSSGQLYDDSDKIELYIHLVKNEADKLYSFYFDVKFLNCDKLLHIHTIEVFSIYESDIDQDILSAIIYGWANQLLLFLQYEFLKYPFEKYIDIELVDGLDWREKLC